MTRACWAACAASVAITAVVAWVVLGRWAAQIAAREQEEMMQAVYRQFDAAVAARLNARDEQEGPP